MAHSKEDAEQDENLDEGEGDEGGSDDGMWINLRQEEGAECRCDNVRTC